MAGRLAGGMDLCPHHSGARKLVGRWSAALDSATDLNQFGAAAVRGNPGCSTAGKNQAPGAEFTVYPLVNQFLPVDHFDLHFNAGDVCIDRHDDTQFFLRVFQAGDDWVDRLLYFIFPDR